MPNLDFVISSKNSPTEAEVRIQGARNQLHLETARTIYGAVGEGIATARRLAPRGPDRPRHMGHRIIDSIQETGRPGGGIYGAGEGVFRRGGAGGGGYFENYSGGFHADARIAPHLRFVWEGTAEKIYPRGNVLKVNFPHSRSPYRTFVRGQKPQREWWYAAQRAADAYVARRIREFKLPEN